MAAPEAATVVVPEDDEDWLYGGTESEKKPDIDDLDRLIEFDKSKNGTESAAKQHLEKDQGFSNGDAAEPAGSRSGDDEDEDDDDDDDVQVTIGSIKTWTGSDPSPRNLFKSGQNYQKSGATTQTKPTQPAKGLDIGAEGTINGTPVYEFDINAMGVEEMPWRKPGADLTDYFNYGFTEETWKLYCEKQKMMRAEAAGLPSQINRFMQASMNSSAAISVSSAKSHKLMDKITYPLPQPTSISSSGTSNIITIGVIGGSTSRRKDDHGSSHVSSHGSSQGRSTTSFNPSMPPPVNFSQPPPALPNSNITPILQGLHLPPPFQPSQSFDPFYPPSVPDANMSQPPPFPYGSTFPPSHPPPFGDASAPVSASQTTWDSSYSDRSDRERDRREVRLRDRDWDARKVVREASPHRDDDLERYIRDSDRSERDRHRDRDRDRERGRDGGRDRSPDRTRDRSPDRTRDRSSDRTREREYRDRDRDRERERDRGDRERERSRSRDRHKSSRSRKHRDRDRDRDDSDTESVRSSRTHKKKRKKDDKEEESSTGVTDEKKD